MTADGERPPLPVRVYECRLESVEWEGWLVGKVGVGQGNEVG